jgi:hypothetical protein
MRAIEDGRYELSMKERLKTVQPEKASLTETNQNAGAGELNILLHSNIRQLYHRKVGELESVPTGPDAMEAINFIRSMIEIVVLRPKVPEKGLDL